MNMLVSTALVGTSLPASASQDPIFAAIDAHKAARKKVYEAIDGGDESPEAAFNDETDAAIELLAIQPTTLAGALALLSYAHSADKDGEGWPNCLHEGDETKLGRSWQYFLIRNLSEVLPEMVAA